MPKNNSITISITNEAYAQLEINIDNLVKNKQKFKEELLEFLKDRNVKGKGKLPFKVCDFMNWWLEKIIPKDAQNPHQDSKNISKKRSYLSNQLTNDIKKIPFLTYDNRGYSFDLYDEKTRDIIKNDTLAKLLLQDEIKKIENPETTEIITTTTTVALSLSRKRSKEEDNVTENQTPAAKQQRSSFSLDQLSKEQLFEVIAKQKKELDKRDSLIEARNALIEKLIEEQEKLQEKLTEALKKKKLDVAQELESDNDDVDTNQATHIQILSNSQVPAGSMSIAALTSPEDITISSLQQNSLFRTQQATIEDKQSSTLTQTATNGGV